MPNPALFPWIEANQGFLSLLALVVALAVAVFEHWRVIRERQEALRHTIRTAIELVDELEAIRAAAWEKYKSDVRSTAAAGFGGEAKRAGEVFRVLAATTPMTGKVALTLMRAARRCEAMQSAGLELTLAPRRMKDAAERIPIMREELRLCLREGKGWKLAPWKGKREPPTSPPAAPPLTTG